MRRIAAWVVVIMMVAACGAAAATPVPTAAPPAPTGQPTSTSAGDATPLPVGPLKPGTYRTTTFQPTVTLTVGDGWTTFFQDDDDEVAMDHIAGAFLGITRVSQVVDPATGTVVPAPDDLIGWLAGHPRFEADAPEPVELAGKAGRSIVVHASRTTETFAYSTGNMRLEADWTARFVVIPMDGPDLTVVVGGRTSAWDQMRAVIDPVLASIEVSPGG